MLRFAICCLSCLQAGYFAAGEEKSAALPPPTPATKTRDEATVLKEFKAEVTALRLAAEKRAKERDGKNPAARMRDMKSQLEKLAAIRTDGLPEDLRKVYDRMAKFWKASGEFYKDMPADDAEVEAWMKKKSADPAVEAKFKPLFMEGKVAGKELLKVAEKYGIQVEMTGK